MMRFLKSRRAQNTAEYAILIALVIGAAVAMQTYLKRGLQGGIKFAVDKSTLKDGTKQYEPYYLQASYDTAVSAYKDTEKTVEGGGGTRTYGADGKVKTTTRSGYQQLGTTANAD